MKKNVLALLLCIGFSTAFAGSTKGKEFWIGFMENISLQFNGPPSFQIHISSDQNTTCTLSVPGSNYSSVLTITANQVYIFEMPGINYFPQGDEGINNNGISLIAADTVEVRAFHLRLYFSESSSILPVSELAGDYAVMTHSDFPQPNSPAEIVILATQNNTTVEIRPAKPTLSGRPGGVTFTVALQRGQQFQLQSSFDLSGTRIRSIDASKRIAVFSGARQSNVICAADDHLYEQAVPFSRNGTMYHVVPMLGHAYDLIKILANENGTSVVINGNLLYNLSLGQVLTFTTNVACEITSNVPIAVSQLATGQGCNGANAKGDGGMINLVSAENALSKTVFYSTGCWSSAGIQRECFPQRRLNIVVKRSAIGSLKVDNVVLPATYFTSISPSSIYCYTRLKLDTMAFQQHSIECPGGFNAITYGFDSYSFYGHHLGYVLGPRPEDETGLGENDAESPLIIFPVPAKDVLTLSSSEQLHAITIYDLQGNVLIHKSDLLSKTEEISIANLPSGVYTIVVKTVSENLPEQRRRFIK